MEYYDIGIDGRGLSSGTAGAGAMQRLGMPRLSGRAAAGSAAAESTDGVAGALSAEDVAAIVARSLASLRVYVVESDITGAQNRVRALVEETTF